MNKKLINIILLLSLTLSACSSAIPTATEESSAAPIAETSTATEESTAAPIAETPSTDANDDEVSRPANWQEETHSNDVEPNYEVVFPDDEVNQITITIDPTEWEAMQANMVELYGEQGSGDKQMGNLPADGERPVIPENQNGIDRADRAPANGERPVIPEDQNGIDQADKAPANGERPVIPEDQNGIDQADKTPANGERPNVAAGGNGNDRVNLTSKDPMWVEATIEFDGNLWTNVGVRYKGNSSLTGAWRTGNSKLPLKLDFDEFEDEYPEIDNQRFYGFKQLSLANAHNDTSFLRDAVSSQILEESGLPVAKTAFYEVILDYGEGPVSLGLYTMIEVIDDTVIERYFGEDEGNIYEAEGSASSFAANTYNQIKTSFQKENNTDSDWSDIEALFNVLHSDLRTEDPAAWRADLESIFDVDGFIKWLAIAAVIEHWDAYGSMSHNYYLYNDPNTGQLTWISWDHNEVMSTGKNHYVSLDKSEINDNWPLIRFLLDDPVYYELYVNDLSETIAGPFNPDHMSETYESMADLIAPYATAEAGEGTFNNAVQQLVDYTYQRVEVVNEFLSNLEK